MKKILLILLLTANLIYSAQIEEIAQNIGQEHFPAAIVNIIAGYSVNGLEIFDKFGTGYYELFPSKPNIKKVDSSVRDIDISVWGWNSIKFDYNLDKAEIFLRFDGLSKDKNYEDWFSLAISIGYKLGVRKFETYTNYKRFYINTDNGGPKNEFQSWSEEITPIKLISYLF